MSIDILVTRHGKKDPKPSINGSEEDRQTIDLSPEGRKKCYDEGKNKISPDYDLVHVITSDFLRAISTAEEMLKGAGYDISDPNKVIVEINPNINIGRGVDWFAPEIPNWNKLPQNEYIMRMFSELYKPHENRPDLPSMAGYAYDLLDATIRAVEGQIKRNPCKGFVLITTHATIIDAFGGAVGGYLKIDNSGNPHLVDFPGAFNMGECIKGRISKAEDDPLIVFDVKGKEAQYKISELKAMRDFHKSFSQYR
jgi:broad specificity phosphatase PhoE